MEREEGGVIFSSSTINRHVIESRKPFFVKIITTDQEERRLRIPPKFAKKYGKMLSNPIKLMVSTGAGMEVELHEDKSNNLWFRKGWLDFARFFLIKIGHILVLRYEGVGSLLHVVIFDNTCTEIDYPISIDENISMRRKSIKEISDQQKENLYVQINDDDDDRMIDIVHKDEEDNGDVQIQIYENEESVLRIDDDYDDEELEMTLSAFAAARKAANLQAAAATLVRRDVIYPSFTITVRPSAVNGRCALGIPAHHYKEYVENQNALGNKMVFLEKSSSGGDEIRMLWPVKYTVNRAMRRGEFCGGFKKFVLYHRLQVGDVCVFQLVSRSPPLHYRVSVFK